MNAPVSLLPLNNRTPWEEAHSLTDAARYPLPTHLVKDVWNPETCPVALLPFLAWGLGLELWKDDWSEQTKRDVVANIWRMKRNKTKLKGIREYLKLVGADVAGAVRPRDKVFAVDPWTDAQRAAINAAMPRIKIYPQAQLWPVQPGTMFLSEDVPEYAAFLGWNGALVPSDAAYRYSERAFYVDGTFTAPCFVENVEGALDGSFTVQIGTFGASVARFFLGMALEENSLFPDDAAQNVISIVPDKNALEFAVPAGLIPSTVHPTQVIDEVAANPEQAFLYAWALGVGVLYPDDAAAHVYDEIVLYDAARVTPAAGNSSAVSFWGWSSFGCAPYTSILTLDIKLQGVPWGFPGPLGLGVVVEPDLTPYWDAIEAVRLSQAFRDDVLISTDLYAPVSFKDGFRFGQFTFGEYRRVTQ